jgi:hypothetical protein
MSRIRLALTIAVFVPLAAVAQEPEDKNKIQRTVPTIEFDVPNANDDGFYTQQYALVLQGHISRPLGQKQWIGFRIYHVMESGELYPQGGGGVSTDDQGAFSVGFLPPAEGWKPGTLRIQGRVNSYPGVTGTAEIKIADQGFQPLKPEWRKNPAPIDSGVVIDTDKPEAGEFFMPPGASFRIRGEFVDGERFRDVNVNYLSVSVVKRLADGTPDKVICAATGSRVFRDTDGQDNKPWFEIEMESPPQPDDYYISIEPSAEGKRLEPWVYELHLRHREDEKKVEKKVENRKGDE